GFTIGTRFHSAPVIRVCDAKPVQLGHTVRADGRWRIFIFAPDENPHAEGSTLRGFCDFLAGSERSPLRLFTPDGADIDSIIDVRAVLQQPHQDIAIGALPSLLLPAKGRLGLRDY